MKLSKGVKLESGRGLPPIPFKGFEDTLGNVNHATVSRSLQFMARNYVRPIQLSDVVTVSEMSRCGFMKAFNRHVGCSPASLIRQARIEFAKRLKAPHFVQTKK
jgi:AraC-like DNA-binding protein